MQINGTIRLTVPQPSGFELLGMGDHVATSVHTTRLAQQFILWDMYPACEGRAHPIIALTQLTNVGTHHPSPIGQLPSSYAHYRTQGEWEWSDRSLNLLV